MLFLKPNNYLNGDWWWLLRKLEKRISLWCDKWLTLGGRYIIVKFVLENIHVYLLSWARIPISILEKIRRRIFRFLWSRCNDKEGYHLIKWDVLTKIKILGGLGFKNIFLFGRALAAKRLWRGLFST